MKKFSIANYNELMLAYLNEGPGNELKQQLIEKLCSHMIDWVKIHEKFQYHQLAQLEITMGAPAQEGDTSCYLKSVALPALTEYLN